jgi:hypothetical protein
MVSAKLPMPGFAARCAFENLTSQSKTQGVVEVFRRDPGIGIT